MEPWPTDPRIKNPSKTGNQCVDYPLLDYGTLGSIALSETSGRWKWSSIFSNSTVQRVRTTGNFVEAFPATRSPPLQLPYATITQRSEQAAAFLRTYLPDIDIPSALIRDELTTDARKIQKFEEFDPQVGAHLATIYCQGASSPCVSLAFPMGELNQELNVSPFVLTEQGSLLFRPSSRAAHTFKTPILQIVSSNDTVNNSANTIRHGPRAQHLAVRTFTSTTIFEAKAKHNSSSATPFGPQLVEKADILSSDVGNKPAVDVKLCQPAGKAGVMVNNVGDVYRYDIHGERVKTHLVHPSDSSSGDGFWRLALLPSSHQCLLASSAHLKLLDFRTNNTTLDLFSIRSGVLTALEDVHDNHLIRLASTSEVLWIDERSPHKPLLGFKHGRQFDRSLNIQTVNLGTPLTFLTSRKNGLITIYDISGSDDGLLHANTAPCALYSASGHNGTNSGQIVLQHPLVHQKDSLSLLRMSEQGTIHSMDIGFSADDDDRPVSDFNTLAIEWSEEIHELHRRAAKLHPKIGPLGARDVRRVDFRTTYEKLFISEKDDLEWGKEKDPDKVYENIENLPLFWQESDGQVENMLTTFDVAFHSGEEPPCSSRADFLTQSAVNSMRGYRALTQGRLSTDKLAKDAPWSCDIFPVLEQDIYLPQGSRISADSFRQYDLKYNPPYPRFLRRESQAREQLAVDLALSGHIFSPRPFAKAPCLDTDKFESMSRAAEALSLNDEPPRAQFGYLHPIPKQDDEDPIKSLPERLTLPLGVRLLLKEWEIGADPHLYKYEDPYSESFEEDRSARPSANEKTTAPRPLASPRLPPIVLTSQTPHPDSEGTMPFKSLSQGSMSRNDPQHTDLPRVEIESDTQSCLAGPHPANKKKVVKKRLGGF